MPPFVARKRHRSPAPQITPSKRAKRSSSVFDSGDTPASSNVGAEKHFLDSLDHSSDASLSGSEGSGFEDVLPARPVKDYDESEEEHDWENAIPEDAAPVPGGAMPSGDLELTLGGDQVVSSLAPKKKGPSKIERQIRIATHCAHVQFLILHNVTRNAWASNAEVQRILLNQLSATMKKAIDDWRRDCGDCVKSHSSLEQTQKGPLQAPRINRLKNSNPRTQRDWGPPAQRQEKGGPNLSRGDPTIQLLNLLAPYWRKKFRVTAPGLRKQGYKPIRLLQRQA